MWLFLERLPGQSFVLSNKLKLNLTLLQSHQLLGIHVAKLWRGHCCLSLNWLHCVRSLELERILVHDVLLKVAIWLKSLLSLHLVHVVAANCRHDIFHSEGLFVHLLLVLTLMHVIVLLYLGLQLLGFDWVYYRKHLLL